MKKVFLILNLMLSVTNKNYCQTAGCYPGIANIDLDINNVRAKILNSGDMWWKLDNGPSNYEIPKGSGKTSLFAGALWIGGIDAGGQLKVAAMTYRQTGNDFWPGPLDTNNATTSLTNCSQYDQLWKINRSDVEKFIQLRGTPGYNIPQEILTYPGNGNTSLGHSRFLAPFHDNNSDGIYNPNDGDYPEFDLNNQLSCNEKLHGDQCIWWVFNDKGNSHTESSGVPLGIEIQSQAFAFRSGDEINDMTFYQYKIINRSNIAINNTFVGKWVDPDLGDYTDDLIGCDVGRGLGYCYNADPNDGTGATYSYGIHPPAVGIDLIQGPLADLNDNIDNNYNGSTDEPGERIGMSKFSFYKNDFSTQGNPETGIHYYNYLKGLWKDGLPITYGGGGYNTGGVNADFMFPGNSDPTGIGTGGIPQLPWEQTAFSNGRFILSAGPFTFEPGEVQNITLAVPWARDTAGNHLDAITKLKIVDDKAQLLFNSCFQLGCESPFADFSADMNELAVTFGYSYNGTSFSWNFGDGTTGTNKYMIHNYSAPGDYNVCLIVSNACGSDTICKLISVTNPSQIQGFKLTRIEGQGNGNLNLEMLPESFDSILTSPAHRVLHPVYDYRNGPVDVRVIDPLSLPFGNFTIQFNGVSDTSEWKIFLQGGTDTVFSNSTLLVGNEQIIPQWGISLKAKQCTIPGNNLNVNNGLIIAGMEFTNPADTWMTGVSDIDNIPSRNWIKSGDNDYQWPDYKETNIYLDPEEDYENLIGRTWAPYRLSSGEIHHPGWGSSFITFTKMAELASVDIVITSDQSKWTRSPVLEMSYNSTQSIGNAKKTNLRKSPSVDKNGNPDGSGTYGMGWFPGYAINIETGERLNIAFGEDSRLASENGADMKWNPTGTMFDGSGTPVFGSKHFIYVFGHNGDTRFPSFQAGLQNELKDIPLYDEGRVIHRILHVFDSLGSTNNAIKREVFADAMWVGMPMLSPGKTLLSSDVKIRFRVAKPYAKYITSSSPVNGNNPMYNFNSGAMAVSIKKDLLEKGKCYVFPNPSQSYISLNFNNSLSEVFNLDIYDVNGNIIHSLINIHGEKVSIETGDFSQGVYFYRLNSLRNTYSGRFVVTR